MDSFVDSYIVLMPFYSLPNEALFTQRDFFYSVTCFVNNRKSHTYYQTNLDDKLKLKS